VTGLVVSKVIVLFLPLPWKCKLAIHRFNEKSIIYILYRESFGDIIYNQWELVREGMVVWIEIQTWVI
jgi:hypothetical protein